MLTQFYESWCPHQTHDGVFECAITIQHVGFVHQQACSCAIIGVTIKSQITITNVIKTIFKDCFTNHQVFVIS